MDLAELAVIARALETRIIIVRPIIIDLTSPPIAVLYRGSFYAPPIVAGEPKPRREP
jgi:hypothetical protein